MRFTRPSTGGGMCRIAAVTPSKDKNVSKSGGADSNQDAAAGMKMQKLLLQCRWYSVMMDYVVNSRKLRT